MSQDEDLVRRALAGEASAVQELTTLVRRLVLGLACKRFGVDPETAEDLLQASLTRLWEHECRALRAWRGNGRLTTYLTVIVSNLWFRERTRLARRDETLRSAPREHRPAPPTPAERLASKEQSREVEAALGQLRPRDRLLLSLRFVDEKSPKEIASMLGMKPATARKALHDAARRLRRLFEDGASELIPERSP